MATLKDYLNKWKLGKLSINAGFLQADIDFKDADRAAAWELYVELLTRVSTQYLNPNDGDEKSALNSLYALFKLTRDIIKRHGPECINFAKIAIIILNQIIRPFTAKWHRLSLQGAFKDPLKRAEFRAELKFLQIQIRAFTKSLADIAKVEDITNLEEDDLT